MMIQTHKETTNCTQYTNLDIRDYYGNHLTLST